MPGRLIAQNTNDRGWHQLNADTSQGRLFRQAGLQRRAGARPVGRDGLGHARPGRQGCARTRSGSSPSRLPPRRCARPTTPSSAAPDGPDGQLPRSSSAADGPLDALARDAAVALLPAATRGKRPGPACDAAALALDEEGSTRCAPRRRRLRSGGARTGIGRTERTEGRRHRPRRAVLRRAHRPGRLRRLTSAADWPLLAGYAGLGAAVLGDRPHTLLAKVDDAVRRGQPSSAPWLDLALKDVRRAPRPTRRRAPSAGRCLDLDGSCRWPQAQLGRLQRCRLGSWR